MAGANLTYKRGHAIRREVNNVLARKGTNRGHTAGKYCFKAGAPEDDTADDAPNAQDDICLDVTNSEVYISTAYTNDTSHTWTKISS